MRKFIFDIGNVLFHVNFDLFNKRLNDLNIHFQNTSKLKTFVNDIQAHQDLGIVNLDQALRHHLGVDDKFIPALVEEWNKCLQPNEKMFELFQKIKSSKFYSEFTLINPRIAIASNMGIDHYNYLTNQYPNLFKGVDMFISSKIGARKPSNLFFQSIIIDYPEYKGALFIDDRKENLEIASRYFQTYHFDLEQLSNSSKLDSALDQLSMTIKSM